MSKKERRQDRDVNHHKHYIILSLQRLCDDIIVWEVLPLTCYASEPCGGSHSYLVSIPF